MLFSCLVFNVLYGFSCVEKGYILAVFIYIQMTSKTRIRSFRIPIHLDEKLIEKTRQKGYRRPSDYIRELIRRDLVEETENNG